MRWTGYDGGFFDGRYIYYVPFLEEHTGLKNQKLKFHSQALRYDTQKPYDDPASWRMKLCH